MSKKRSIGNSEDLRIAVYCRVSTQQQVAEGDSIEAQQHTIAKWIELKKAAQGWSVKSVHYYVEEGKSAKDQKRPELQRLKRDIAAGHIDAVVCFKLDRITRSLQDFIELWRLFEDKGVQVVSIREEFDTSTPTGKAMIRLVMIFAELERDLIAERTVATMRDRVDRGLWNGGHVYGYLSDPANPGRLVPDNEWADIIRRHFFDALERLGSAGGVQRELRTLGIFVPTRTSRFGKKRGGRPFSKQQVLGIMRNPIYIGRVSWGDLSKDDCHPPIITKVQFDRVQRILDETTIHRSNRRVSRGHVYLLRSLVRCSCGASMTPKGAHGRTGRHFYYACTRQNHMGGQKACSSPSLPAEALERAVLARIADLGDHTAARDQIIQAALKMIDVDAEGIERDMNTATNRLGTIQAEISNLLAVLKAIGEKGLVSIRDELARLESEHAEIRVRLDQLAQRKAPADATTEAARKFIESWTGVNDLLTHAIPEEQQMILQHLIEVVELRPADEDPSKGSYALRLWPELPSFDKNNGGKELRQTEGETNNGRPLTERPLVRGVDERAPRLGLEPRT